MRTDISFFKSLRFKVSAFFGLLVAVLLLMLNIYPITSSRDMVFEEKKNAMTSQAAVISTSVAGLDRPDRAGIAEVLRVLDIGGYERIIVANETGTVLYDSGGKSGSVTDREDILTSLKGKTVFRSRFEDAAFSSSIWV